MSAQFRQVGTPGSERSVNINIGQTSLSGDLAVPKGVSGLVLFSHGSGSSRFSPRNRFVARMLREAGIGTLLFDLLTEQEEIEEEEDAHLRFDIGLLARRLLSATDWVKEEPDTRDLELGYFGASTGAAAALAAAAERVDTVKAVVSRGGRPDLAPDSLPLVQAATLLVVGGLDQVVLDLNRQALNRISAVKKLMVIPGATHLFEEPGALQEVGRLAAEWFKIYLNPVEPSSR